MTLLLLQAVDMTFRPSDQNASLRNYGRMDRDLWDRMELRGWFDKYYKPQGLDFIDYEQTRYLNRYEIISYLHRNKFVMILMQ